MRNISTLEPTRYEITAVHDDGRTFLIAYAGGSPSRRRLISTIQERTDWIVGGLQIARDAQFAFGTKPRPFAKACGWVIAYSGRTQRDVRNEANAHPFIGA